MNFDNNKNNNAVNITRLILINQDKKVNEMYRRSFNMNSDTETINNLEYLVRSGNNATKLNMIQTAGNLVSLTPTTQGLISVANGWNVKRLSFVLVVEVIRASTLKDIYFFNGFSEFYDPIITSINGINSIKQLDGNMIFHINTMTKITEMLDAQGNPSFSFRDKITVLRNSNNGVAYESFANDECLIRAEDIMSDVYYGGEADNLSAMYEDKPNEAKRTDSNTVGYINSIMNCIIDGSRTTGSEDMQVSKKNVVHNIASAAVSPNMMNCPFLLKLYGITGQLKPSSFTINNLLQISPYLDNVTEMFNTESTGIKSNTVLSTNMLSDNLQPTICNLIALEFYQLVSSLCFDNMITEASIVVSNHPQATMQTLARCFKSDSLFHPIFNTPAAIDNIDTYLERIILPKVTRSDNMFVDINAHINILGTSTVAIIINDNDPEVYRYNSSMDNIFNPFISNASQKSIITDEVATLIDTITS